MCENVIARTMTGHNNKLNSSKKCKMLFRTVLFNLFCYGAPFKDVLTNTCTLFT